VDVNVGDPVWPAPALVRIPRLLDPDPILVNGYPLPMVLAEKVVTAIARGTASTRWRDFSDIVLLSSAQPVDGLELRRAVEVVAAHRRVVLLPLRDVLAGFAPLARSKWSAWYRGQGLEGRVPEDFAEVLGRVLHFVDPVLENSPIDGARWDAEAMVWATSP
jgi:hypothetical protein